MTGMLVRYIRPNPSSLGCIGIGDVGQLIIDSLLSKFQTIKEVNIYGRSEDRLHVAAEKLRSKYPQYIFRLSTNIQDITLNSEILVLATTSATPIISIDSIPDDILILNLSLRDADESIFLNCDYIIIDDWKECSRKGKVIHSLVKNGLMSKADIYSDLGKLVAGIDTIPANRPSRTMVFAAGLSIHDITFAALLYKRSLDKNIGITLEC
jgi:ornithine cyclodeaminase/alanine dehydrogenase-like protein (mu-crystallin family)